VPKIITGNDFVTLIRKWAKSNLAEIINAYTQDGKGWEEWLKTQLTSAIHKTDISIDVGREKSPYIDVKETADFLLNDATADSAGKKTIVEFKAQSPGRIKNFVGDVRKDEVKLTKVSAGYAAAARLMVGFCYTKDVGTWSEKTVGKGIGGERATANFVEFLDDYDRLFITEKSELQLGPGSMREALSVEEAKKDTSDLCFFWKYIPAS
jgi:hypothetical protein